MTSSFSANTITELTLQYRKETKIPKWLEMLIKTEASNGGAFVVAYGSQISDTTIQKLKEMGFHVNETTMVEKTTRPTRWRETRHVISWEHLVAMKTTEEPQEVEPLIPNATAGIRGVTERLRRYGIPVTYHLGECNFDHPTWHSIKWQGPEHTHAVLVAFYDRCSNSAPQSHISLKLSTMEDDQLYYKADFS